MRDPGFYWVKVQPRRLNGSPIGEVLWTVRFFDPSCGWLRMGGDTVQVDTDFLKIDERRLTHEENA